MNDVLFEDDLLEHEYRYKLLDFCFLLSESPPNNYVCKNDAVGVTLILLCLLIFSSGRFHFSFSVFRSH